MAGTGKFQEIRDHGVKIARIGCERHKNGGQFNIVVGTENDFCLPHRIAPLPADTRSSPGRLLSTLLAAITEFGRDPIHERTGDGRKRHWRTASSSAAR
jgi:hypothetical protein